jgi:WD40 repeat protein
MILKAHPSRSVPIATSFSCHGQNLIQWYYATADDANNIHIFVHREGSASLELLRTVDANSMQRDQQRDDKADGDDEDEVNALCFCQVKGTVLLFIAFDRRLLFCAVNGESNEPQSFDGSSLWTDSLRLVAVHPKGTYFATADDSGDICLFEIDANLLNTAASSVPVKLLSRLRLAHQNVPSTLWFRDDRPLELVSTGMDGLLIQWNGQTPKSQSTWNVSEWQMEQKRKRNPESCLPAYYNPPWIWSASYSPRQCKQIALGLGDGSIVVAGMNITKFPRAVTMKEIESTWTLLPTQNYHITQASKSTKNKNALTSFWTEYWLLTGAHGREILDL